MDYIGYWTDRAELPAKQLLGWLELSTSQFHTWKDRYGKANEHNGKIPRDFWLEDWERQAILDYHDSHPLDGYRRLTFMMLDDDIVAVSPSSVYRVLRNAGRLDRNRWAPSKKGTGFVQPDGPHKHWHGSLKQECIRPACPATIEDARRRVADYVDQYNHRRLHSAIGYIAPADKLTGLEKEIFDERDRKLEEARERRALSRQSVACEVVA